MSINRIYYNGDTNNSSSQNINVGELIVNETMLYKKKDYEQLGEFLTCYANGRATFLNLPKITTYKFALVGFDPLTYGNGDSLLTLNEDAACVDLDNIVTSRSGDVNSLRIDEAGLYWVTYKITRLTNEKLVKSSMKVNNGINDTIIPGSIGTLPFGDSTISDEGISVSFLAAFDAGFILTLSVNVYSSPDVGNFSLANNQINQVPPLSKSELSPSFISLLKIGV